MPDDMQAPMKPQDTVIFLLGELKGQVTSLKGSVDVSAASQAVVNTANEAEHAKFREEISKHDSMLAVLTDAKKTQSENRVTNVQKIAIWVAAPTGLAALIGLIAVYIHQSI